MAIRDISSQELQHRRQLLAEKVRRQSETMGGRRPASRNTPPRPQGAPRPRQGRRLDVRTRARQSPRIEREEQQVQPAARSRERVVQLRSMRERVERARAQQALRAVQDPSWWNRASASDLERMRAIANRAASTRRQAIHGQMQHVARTRYGTTVSGAIQYERSNPSQPPPDVTHTRGPVR